MFSLKSDSSSFSSKVNSIFDGIDKLESDRAIPTSSAQRDNRKEFDIVEENIIRENARYMYSPSPSVSRPQEVVQFKKPKPPRKPRNKTPDFVVNPQNWTKYSLEDVPDMDNASNARAAFSFLDEMRKRKAEEGQSEAVTEGEFKPVFKKPKIKRPAPAAAEKRKLKEAKSSCLASPSNKLEESISDTAKPLRYSTNEEEKMEVDSSVKPIQKRKNRNLRKSNRGDDDSDTEKTEEMQVETISPTSPEKSVGTSSCTALTDSEEEAVDSNSSYVSTSSMSGDDSPPAKTEPKSYGPLKFVMPEFQFGKKGKGNKEERKSDRATSDRVKLTHLDEYEDDE